MKLKYKRIIVTGGAGFVGSNLAIRLKSSFPDAEVIAVDNLYRSGSEKNLDRLKKANIVFLKIDVRDRATVNSLPKFDLLVECSAEPSVKAGYEESPLYLLDTNLTGVINCVEAARINKAKLVFLSTSRVYSISKLRNIPLEEKETRFIVQKRTKETGLTEEGINCDFSTIGYRSLYGASKLAAEMVLQEYHHTYGVPIFILRSGVIAGPWQLGKVDQGFLSHWCKSFLLQKDLKYIGFNGLGKQVRDILHIDDLCDFMEVMLQSCKNFNAEVNQIGGGLENSTSLLELTQICKEITGNKMMMGSTPQTHPSDIPYFVSDNKQLYKQFTWKPRKSVQETVNETLTWLEDNPVYLRDV